MPPDASEPTTTPSVPLDSASDEAALVQRLKEGDDAAYESLVRGLTGRLFAVARRIAKSDADAEDAVQEAFLSAFRAIHSFDGRSTLSTWLHRIVVNAALMKARKASSRRESPLEDLLPKFEGGLHRERPPRWRAVTPAEVASIEEKHALRDALDALPEEYRAVIVLKDLAGLQSSEIAASLGVSDALVRQRLHRGRQALVKLLTPAMAQETPR